MAVFKYSRNRLLIILEMLLYLFILLWFLYEYIPLGLS
ncbi:hypothetical protein CFE_2227 [Carboxydocella thermautotrophica]|uniref:Uncharacterized protein n=1 Tax=Carboxydocella thermautotrophica TaxID=178899 RepID=A0A2R4N2R7_CARTR|nr:hypothetical protein CFE_2227 [Carboxydocella thermautotrophica]AVX31868.1 hypothetical protein CTH_2329 [Carboxydocella thermautotrophica]